MIFQGQVANCDLWLIRSPLGLLLISPSGFHQSCPSPNFVVLRASVEAGAGSCARGLSSAGMREAQTGIPTVWSWIEVQGVPGNKQCSGFFQLQTSRIKARWLFLLGNNSFNICLSRFLPPQFLFWIFSLEYGNKSVSSRFDSSDMNVSHPVNASSGS